jgi:maltooligosyltrehalose trehalohydrolase
MKSAGQTLCYGATLQGGQTEFRVWAPRAQRVRLCLNGKEHEMQPAGGDFTLTLPARAGDRYFYAVDGHQPVPDPVSRFLPEGVHGPTEIVDADSFTWTDAAWRGLERDEYILYELHVGTFTPQGTFDGVIQKLDYLKRLGVTAIELMPVAAFPGTRNWGYDGVSPYAVQASYGGPEGLKRLVDAAHGMGLAVVLDVVYNHLGPEGNYLRLFGPYFTNQHQTPWGEAVNYDQAGREGVRRYVVENALYWVREYHMDGLRLDAIQTIRDDSPQHIVAEIQEAAQKLARALGRRVCVIAETDENQARHVLPVGRGGWGLDGVWSDDFHHAMHACLTGERKGYYQDFGRKEQIVRALNDGFVFQGEHFKYWNAARGSRPEGVPLAAHVIAMQNHDQVGNRAQGDRITLLAPQGARKLAATLLLLAPHTPLLFMGQEYGERAPFQFFTSFGDPVLQKAVREGRRREFAHFGWKDDEVPDPEDPQTFERSRLDWSLPKQSPMLPWYKKLLALRRRLVMTGERTCRAELREGAVVMQVPATEPRLLVAARLPDAPRPAKKPPAAWRRILRSDEDGYEISIYERE